MAAKTRNMSLEKLAFIGKRGMGALEFVPEIKRDAMTDKIDIKAWGEWQADVGAERYSVWLHCVIAFVLYL